MKARETLLTIVHQGYRFEFHRPITKNGSFLSANDPGSPKFFTLRSAGVHFDKPGSRFNHQNGQSRLLIAISLGNQEDLIGCKVRRVLCEALFNHQAGSNLGVVHAKDFLGPPAFGIGGIDFVCA